MDELSFFDKFLYKLVIGLVLLLGLVLLNKFEVINLASIKNEMDSNINVLEVIKNLNGKFEFIDLGETDVEVNKEILDYTEVDGKYKINTDSYVPNYVKGVVVKIERNITYTITILGIDGVNYVYENLETIDVHIYKYLEPDALIGSCNEFYYLRIED